MNAPTLVAAALAVALDESREAAVCELMLDLERAAMANEDARSYMAPAGAEHDAPHDMARRSPPRSKRPAWTRDAMHAALRAQRRGDGDRMERVLVDELGSSTDEAEEEEESSHEGGMSDHEDALVCVICERRQDGNQRRRVIHMRASCAATATMQWTRSS